MGLLPIFLTLTAFIFLWGLVNYNSFVAQQARITELQAAAYQSKERFEALVEQLSQLFKPAGSAAAPGYPQVTGREATDPDAPDFPTQVAAAWRRFAEGHLYLQDQEEVAPLLDELEETAEAQYRTRLRLLSAIADYNGHRQRMPYRLVAQLFNFKSISGVA